MYRQGLGDSFLLTFWSDDDPVHVLVDCGVLKGTPDAGERLTSVARNIHETTDGHVHVLVATHEHWDHVSGFLQAQEIFDTLEVGEVWLAWTEDPTDKLGQDLRQLKRSAKRAIALAANRLGASGSENGQRVAERINGLLDFEGDPEELAAADSDFGAAGSKTTAGAMTWVKRRGKPEPRYLMPQTVTSVPGVDGVRVYVLGPPHDAKQIKKSDPSKAHSEVYELAGTMSFDRGFLAAVGALGENATSGGRPFAGRFGIPEAEAGADDFFREHYYAAGDEWRRVEDDWLGVAERLALQLDSDTNNTSLVLAFELPNDDVLLFPGDAQVGNWLSWQLHEWNVEDGSATRTVRARDLLARTVLYKVGHHGSHNATLRELGLELMTSGSLTAMVPVDRPTAKKKHWKMPFPALFRRLEERTRGRIMDAELGVATENPGPLSDADWKGFTARTVVQERTDDQPGWIDYTLEW